MFVGETMTSYTKRNQLVPTLPTSSCGITWPLIVAVPCRAASTCSLYLSQDALYKYQKSLQFWPLMSYDWL